MTTQNNRFRFTDARISEVLDLHAKWVRRQEGGQRADFNDANLSDVYLCGANLRGADFCDAKLRRAYFRDADLRSACLCGADLYGADLGGADLDDADLSGANLYGADLHGANLHGANLHGANFRDAYLRDANLSGADLCDAKLRRADLRDADLYGAYLRGADVSHNHFVTTATLGRYSVYAYIDRSGFRITAGCRKSLTLAEALEHWSPKNCSSWSEATEEYGERMTRIVRFLESEARLLGWDVDGSSEESA